MKNCFIIACFLISLRTAALQQYRLLPTCDSSDDARGPIVLKGDKGDRGNPGKIGPKGIQGSLGAKGSFGAKGSKGEIANCSAFLRNLTERIIRMIF